MTAFNPSFPASCPYITAVGATQVKPNATVTQPEEAAESVSKYIHFLIGLIILLTFTNHNFLVYSGGGFSNVFSTPEYQTDALATYCK